MKMETSLKAIDTSRIQILAIIGSVLLIATIFELVRRGRLREEYALMWFISSFVLLFFSIWRSALDFIAHRLGVAYSPALLLLVMLLFGFLILVHFSIAISKLTGENKRLAQEMALLVEQMKHPESPSTQR
jgi:hypothetical protein